MKLIIKRISDEVNSIEADFLLYVRTDTDTSIHVEVSNSEELEGVIQSVKSKYDIKETIIFDL